MKKENKEINDIFDKKDESELEIAKKKGKGKKVTKIFLSLFCFFIFCFLFLFYGPWNGFRDFWITTAMTTMNHQYLATLLYSDETINEVLENNRVIEPVDITDTNMIEIYDSEINEIAYKDKYDKEILDHEEGALYKYIKLTGYKFDAYLVAVYDASKISLVHTKYLGKKGEYLVDMAKRENAIVAINGSAFNDPKGYGNGGQPKGIVIEDGKIIQSSRNRTHGGGIIGFTSDDKLLLGNMSAQKAIEAGVRDAVEFGPYLVVNGKSMVVKGNGGYGIHPRTAIGQRKDGIVLFLVIDGRRVDSIGASIKDTADIMLKYGAYNAANLDGGNSSALVINNKIVNRPINWGNQEATRPIATGFIVTE